MTHGTKWSTEAANLHSHAQPPKHMHYPCNSLQLSLPPLQSPAPHLYFLCGHVFCLPPPLSLSLAAPSFSDTSYVLCGQHVEIPVVASAAALIAATAAISAVVSPTAAAKSVVKPIKTLHSSDTGSYLVSTSTNCNCTAKSPLGLPQWTFHRIASLKMAFTLSQGLARPVPN